MIKNITAFMLGLLLVLSIAGCASSGEAAQPAAEETDSGNPAEITDAAPGAGSVGGTDEAFINFEKDFGSYTYAPGTALTTKDSKSTVEASKDFYYAGAQSMRIDGTLQKDKYGDAIEIGYRINAAEMLGKKNIELLNKTISFAVYIPAEFSNNVVQLVVLDKGYQWAIGPAIAVPKGEWTKVYFKLLGSSHADNTKYPGVRPSLAAYDADGNKVAGGAYTGDTFNVYALNAFGIRILSGVAGDNATAFIDSISWE